MFEGAAEPIEFPDDQHIARAQGLEQLGEDWPLGAGAADDLGVDLGATGLRERIDLQIDRLILGADACVPHVHGHPPELVTVQFTRLNENKANVVFPNEYVVPCACGFGGRT